MMVKIYHQMLSHNSRSQKNGAGTTLMSLHNSRIQLNINLVKVLWASMNFFQGQHQHSLRRLQRLRPSNTMAAAFSSNIRLKNETVLVTIPVSRTQMKYINISNSNSNQLTRAVCSPQHSLSLKISFHHRLKHQHCSRVARARQRRTPLICQA